MPSAVSYEVVAAVAEDLVRRGKAVNATAIVQALGFASFSGVLEHYRTWHKQRFDALQAERDDEFRKRFEEVRIASAQMIDGLGTLYVDALQRFEKRTQDLEAEIEELRKELHQSEMEVKELRTKLSVVARTAS